MYDLGFVLEPGLERLLQDLGVRMAQAMVMDPTNHYATSADMVGGDRLRPASGHAPRLLYVLSGRAPNRAGTAGGGHQDRTPDHEQPGQLCDARSPRWNSARSPTAGDNTTGVSASPSQHVLAAAIEGTLPGEDSEPFRAIVIGDGDFASNSFYPYMANSDLALTMVRWLLREEDKAAIAPKIAVPPLILLTGQQMQAIFVVVELLLPLTVLLLGGCVVWWRRR